MLSVCLSVCPHRDVRAFQKQKTNNVLRKNKKWRNFFDRSKFFFDPVEKKTKVPSSRCRKNLLWPVESRNRIELENREVRDASLTFLFIPTHIHSSSVLVATVGEVIETFLSVFLSVRRWGIFFSICQLAKTTSSRNVSLWKWGRGFGGGAPD